MGKKMMSRHNIAKFLLKMSRQCLDMKFWRKIFENAKKPIFLRFIKNEAENKKSILLEA